MLRPVLFADGAAVLCFEHIKSITLWRSRNLAQWPLLLLSLSSMPGVYGMLVKSHVGSFPIDARHQTLYKGYKRRNVQLDDLAKAEPSYLVTSSVPLANQTFAEVETEEVLQEVYDYLAKRHALLDRVIRARKLHHSRFFSLELDYGHQHYLDSLSNQKFLVSRALERLLRRTAEVLYQKQRWFGWVRQLENDEEMQRENERKKIKREAALFRRHEKEFQQRQQELKAKEDVRKQELALEEALKQRAASGDQPGNEEEVQEWDPIEDALEDERGNYTGFIRHFLLLVTSTADESNGGLEPNHSKDAPPSFEEVLSLQSDDGSPTGASPSQRSSANGGKSNRTRNKWSAHGTAERLPNMSGQESTEQIWRRLKEGVKHSYASGYRVAGTIDDPVELQEKTAPLPDDEVDQLLFDIAEIKQLLFCRLLLSQATLLPAALNAASVEDFLNNRDIADADLRDLCLKMESPGLQEIRDACADFGRGEEEDENAGDDDHSTSGEDNDKDADDDIEVKGRLVPRRDPDIKRAMPRFWAPDRERRMETRRQIPQSFFQTSQEDNTKTLIDFGDLDAEGEFKPRRMRVKICGKYIYNHPSEKSVPRKGWLQFSIIAKDSHLYDVIKLCRGWDEFWELSTLVIYRYFPAAHWLIWKGDHTRSQLLKLGFIPYYSFDKANQMTKSAQTGSRRGSARQAHVSLQMRNFMCAHLNRDDPTSRRFLQYISAETHRVVVLVRDAKTGRILKTPPPEHLWLVRTKSGFGRASRTDWEIRAEVGSEFFAKMEESRQWHFGFKEHYDVYIWDLEPGEYFANLYNAIQQALMRAHRCSGLTDMLSAQRPILETLTREMSTMRVRDIIPGEQVNSLWDEVVGGRSVSLDFEKQGISEDPCSKRFFYTKADAAEDSVLFPEESSIGEVKPIYKAENSAIDDFMKKGPDWQRFIMDLDTDEELEDESESNDEDDCLTDNESTQSDNNRDGSNSSDDEDNGRQENESNSNQAGLGSLANLARLALAASNLPGSDQQISVDQDGESDNAALASALVKVDGRRSRPTLTDDQARDMALLMNWKSPRRWGADPKKDFTSFIDREKSKAFKRCWHRADMHPGAQAQYIEQLEIVRQIAKYQDKHEPFRFVHDLRFVDAHPDKNRLVIRDICGARAMMLMFFPGHIAPELNQTVMDSPLVSQGTRALDPPVRRSFLSNINRSKTFCKNGTI